MTRGMLTCGNTALETTQFPNAFVPLDSLVVDSGENRYRQRYPMWL